VPALSSGQLDNFSLLHSCDGGPHGGRHNVLARDRPVCGWNLGGASYGKSTFENKGRVSHLKLMTECAFAALTRRQGGHGLIGGFNRVRSDFVLTTVCSRSQVCWDLIRWRTFLRRHLLDLALFRGC
jgi:hypothetical protein